MRARPVRLRLGGERLLRRPAGRVEPRLHAAAPDMADRQRERVGGVGRTRALLQAQQARDHRGHLRLVRLTGAGDGRLDLARRIGAHGQPRPRRGQDRDRPGLGGPHHGADVVLAEHALDGNLVGPVLGEHGAQRRVECQQAGREILLRTGAYDVVGDEPTRPPRLAVDDADAAPGQPRVHAQHPHTPSLVGTDVLSQVRSAAADDTPVLRASPAAEADEP